MRSVLALALLTVLATGCGPRQVEVKTAPAPAASMSVHVTNNLREAANIYINSGGTDIFVGQVQPNSSADLPVSGVASGTTVTLRAKTAGGTGYSKANVLMSGSVTYTIP
jgi:hypothetical protein